MFPALNHSIRHTRARSSPRKIRRPSANGTRPPAVPASLKPRDAQGFLFLTGAGLVTAGAALLAVRGDPGSWLLAQVLFAFAFLQWFIILHEAGHHTLFRRRRLNRITGHIAGFLALIPFRAWQPIHARHHRWTGWQDLDATTANLVPHPLQPWERWAIRVAWRMGLPLFSILYRLHNFWHLARIRRFVPASAHNAISGNMVVLLACYLIVIAGVGVTQVLSLCGVGLVLSLMLQDPLLLSQHTHIPQRLSRGRAVRPFAPQAQGAFTRSLRFPKWFSYLILNFDAHALHHMYVHVPGYDLHKIRLEPARRVHWWRWLCAVKRLPGDVFLFQNQAQTGFKL